MPARRLNPCSFLPRRLQVVASLTAFLLFCVLFLGTSNTDDFDPYLNNVPYGPQLQNGAHHAVEGVHKVVDRLPNALNPFRPPAHEPPPEQANSSNGAVRWYSDWKWKNPFSSSITWEEERAVLPPMKDRPTVYTYYDPSGSRKDEKRKKAEQELIQVWRRAWWAQGFRPVVLSESEAKNNPLYRTLQGLELQSGFETELMRWLAWGNMGTGILCNWLALPMAPHDDTLLSFLRRGEYPALTQYEGLDEGLYIGSREDIEAALKEAIASPAIKSAKTMVEAVPRDTIQLDSPPDAIAFYSTSKIRAKYPPIKEKLDNSETIGEALDMLADLINSHLHLTWQNQFEKGIQVAKPLPEHTSAIIEPAIDIARNLSQCPQTPLQSSCPPNKPNCKTCVSNRMMIKTQKILRNNSAVFTIATVPHPYSLQSLLKSKQTLDLAYIRRHTTRDSWVLAATKELLGSGISSFARLPSIKDMIASDFGISHSLWLTAERPFMKENTKDLEELDWIFGFRLPRDPVPSGKSETPVPGPERRPPPISQEYGDGPGPSAADLKAEKALLEKAKKAIYDGEPGGRAASVRLRNAVEAWNLADTETWKFVRAFNARRGLERHDWQEAEDTYLGRGLFDRWIDKIS